MIFEKTLCPCTALVPVEVKPQTYRKKPRVCVYARSFSEQESHLQSQVRELLADCGHRGLTVAEQYGELAKPYKIIRPALLKMLYAVHRGRVDVLAVTELSRLSAQRWKLKLILRYLYRHNVQLLTAEAYLPYNLYRVGLDGSIKIWRCAK